MNDTASVARAILRVSVQSDGRRLDIGVPAQLPLIEIMPSFARNLGVLEPTLAHAGYGLQRADGTILDPSRGAAEQGVEAGELLTLTRGGQLAQPRVYDDIVEAVLDATREHHRPWSAQDNARTALAVSLGLLAVCAALLLAAGPALGVGTLIAAGGTLTLVAISAVVSRLGQAEAGHGLGMAAAAYGALAAYLATAHLGPLWGVPLAAAGAGMLVVGVIVYALTPHQREIQLAPVVVGAVFGLTALIAAAMPNNPIVPFALMVALSGTLANGLPWLIMSSTRIRVISPQSDAEVFADPPPINAEDVKRRAAIGARTLVSVRIALGVCVLASVPLVASANPASAILCVLACLGTMFPARQVYARGQVAAIMTVGTLGLAVSGITVALTQPDLHLPMVIILITATAITVTVTLLAPGARTRAARLADIAEVAVLALLLPLGVIAAGLV